MAVIAIYCHFILLTIIGLQMTLVACKAQKELFRYATAPGLSRLFPEDDKTELWAAA